MKTTLENRTTQRFITNKHKRQEILITATIRLHIELWTRNIMYIIMVIFNLAL
jgi:hypothetical protein